MQYPTISAQDAARYLKARTDEKPILLDDVVRWAGAGERMPDKQIDILRDQLNKLRSKFPKKLRARDPQGGRFENEALVSVHSAFKTVERVVIADPEFWIWLAVARLCDIL